MSIMDIISIVLKLPGFLVACGKIIDFIKKLFDKK